MPHRDKLWGELRDAAAVHDRAFLMVVRQEAREELNVELTGLIHDAKEAGNVRLVRSMRAFRHCLKREAHA